MRVFCTHGRPPVLGGILIVELIAVLARVQGSFRHYDARKPSP